MKVSFITPTHNHEKYIEKCICSVLEQDSPEVEQIIVDDGSTDRTGEIAKSFESENVKYFFQKNIGVKRLADTYNFAVSKAEGDIIAILEGDDYATPIRASRHRSAFTDPTVCASWGITLRKDGDINLDMRPSDSHPFLNMGREEFIKTMLKGCHISANTVAVRKKTLERIGGFQQGPYYVDYPTWLKMLPEGKFHFTPEILSIWGVHSDSFSSIFGNDARPDKDAISAYENFPPHLQQIINRQDLIRYWKKVIVNDRIRQSMTLLKNGYVMQGSQKGLEAIRVRFE